MSKGKKDPFLEIEIKAREELVKRLQNPVKLLKNAAEKEKAKRVAIFEKTIGEYKTLDDAHEAYGFDCITEKEYEQIKEAFEKGEKYIEENISSSEIALHILQDFVGRLYKEIRSFKFEQLSPEEQAKIVESNYEFIEKIRRRHDGET